jgi:hypothetical protein
VSVTEKAEPVFNVWKWKVDDSNLERFVDCCGYVSDADPSGRYLLGVIYLGDKTGIYEVSISDRNASLCFPT